MSRTTFLLLVGNSGVGKSFIGSALVGDGVFTSSHQVGSVTACVQSVEMYDPQGNFWRIFDMPGLMEADSHNLERNAKEITKAFNAASGRPVVVAFILTLEGGRMRAEHVESINHIKNSVQGLTLDNTVIIVNKVRDDEPEEEVRSTIRKYFPHQQAVAVMKHLSEIERRDLCHPAVQNGVASVHAALRACTAATIQAQQIQGQTVEAERQRREKALRDEADCQRKAGQEAADRQVAERLQQIWHDEQRAADLQRQTGHEKELLRSQIAAAEKAYVDRANEQKRLAERLLRYRHQ